MALDTTVYDKHLAAVIAHGGSDTFTLRHVSYACVASDLRKGQALRDEGFSLDADFIIVTRVALFTAANDTPKPNDVVTYKGEEYRIAANGVSKSWDGVDYKIFLVGKTQ